MNIATWSEENVQCFGDYDAVIADDRTWRSTELHLQACRMASALVAAGLTPGDRVLLLLPNGAELIVAFTAVIMSGGIAVPLFVGTTAHECERVIAHCTPFAVVAGDRALATLAMAATAASFLISASGPTSPAGWVSMAALIDSPAALVSPVSRADADPALICFTSGTSSTPKGVVYTHAGIRARHPRANRRPHRVLGPASVLAALPLGTMGAMMLTGRLTAKTLLVLHDGFEPHRFVATIEQHRIRTLSLVPSMAEAILALPDLGQRDLGSLRNVTLGGSHVAPELLERLAAVLPVPPTVSYGMTEAGGGISASLFQRRRDGGRTVSAGVAMASVDVNIRDEHGREAGPEQIGEIFVRTPWLAAGYYGQPELTAELFQDGWLRTGDLGYRDSHGELHVVGRHKDVIIQAGVNVHPSEVEATIRSVDGVASCAVVGVADAFLGEEVVACVVPAAGASLSGDAVIDACRERLDPRKVPVRAVLLSALPVTPAGKLDSTALRHQVRAATAEGDPTLLAALTRSTRERRQALMGELIAGQIIELQPNRDLGRIADSDQADRTFEELGLDSLQLVRLSHRIGATLGQPVSPLLAFGTGTVAALAARLAAELFVDEAPVPPAARRDRSAASPIAIVGIGCRTPPGSEGPEALWTLLDASLDATAEIRRWALASPSGRRTGVPASATTRAALLEDVEGFDATFFGMSPREAAGIDPQHRLALEVTWQAIEHAGWNPLSMRGTRTGVFLGMSGSGDPSLEGLGAAPSMATARIGHFLDLHGPAVVVDTACSSSLFAIHAAVQSLRTGECEVAIAGGVSIIGSPRSFIGLSQLGTLAPDGRCKAFDADADGYGRGEGCVLFVLKPLADADAHGDRVLAVIRGTAAVHDGRSTSLAAPNGQAQEDVIRRALADAGVEASSVDYLEAHGTGTPIGDPIEIGAAMAVLGHPARRVVVGSIKSNIGHLEAAAGAAGLLKVVLALQHERIPAHLHLRQLNPLLEPLASQILIPATSHPWPARAGRQRIAGVTSMGLSGTNVHVIVEEAAPRPTAGLDGSSETSPRLLCLSARTEASLDAQVQRVADHLESVTASFADYCFTSAVGRAAFTHRAAVVAVTPQHASAELRASLHGSSAAVSRGTARTRTTAFLFSGHGTQHVAMGKTLYDQQPVFRDALHRCEEILRPLVITPLLSGLGLDGTAPAGAPPLDDPGFAQPALVSFAWALAELWMSWGITPAWVAGHSLGECTAACVAGLLSIEDTLALAAARGRLLASLSGIGGMVAVRASAGDVAERLHEYQASVAIAAINGPRSTVVSGHRQPLEHIVATFTAAGIETRWLAVPCAAHSPVTDPVLDELERHAAKLACKQPHLPMVSTLTGQVASVEELSNPQYWRRQMREPVRFAEAVTTLVEAGCDTFVEIGPDAVLLAGAQDAVREQPGERIWVATQRRDRDANEQMLASLGELFVWGISPAWPSVYADAPRRRVVLPPYAFDRQPLRRDTATTTAGAPAAQYRPAERPAVDRPPAGRSFRQRVVTAAPAERHALTLEWIQREFALSTGAPPSDVTPDRSCLELGLDSLRIADLAARIERAFGVACTPVEIVSHPTPDALSRWLGAALPAPRSAPAHAPSASHAEPSITPPREERPLVVLHRRGSRPALFCFHPSGGRISAYLRLRVLLGDDQPLYAIQSRAVTNPAREHLTLAGMAIDYASLVDNTCEPPYALLGWSLGGLIAHAVAGELERRGAAVTQVTMIDARQPHRHARTFARDRALGLMAWLLETQPRLSAGAVRASLSEHDVAALTTAELVGWCERRGFIPRGVVTTDALEASLGLYHRHFALADAYEPRPVIAPIDQWWVERAEGDDAREAFGADVRQHLVSGTHFSVMQSPTIDTIAAALAAGDRLPSLTGRRT